MVPSSKVHTVRIPACSECVSAFSLIHLMSRMWDRQLVLIEIWPPFFHLRDIHEQSKGEEKNCAFLMGKWYEWCRGRVRDLLVCTPSNSNCQNVKLDFFLVQGVTRNCRCFKLLFRIAALWHIIQRPSGFVYSRGLMEPDNCLERLRTNFSAFTLECCACFLLNGSNYTLVFC